MVTLAQCYNCIWKQLNENELDPPVGERDERHPSLR